MHNYTPEDLLLYLYKESSTEQAMAIEEELKTNWALREKIAVMKTAMERLNNLVITPRTEAVLSIFRHAQESQAIKSR
ncbi:MAG TPA: hypothetical protein VM871_08245 [Flavisolibacter sp.]|jgi:predicted GIY-YIG superfamily endonuclease|nr:hypothetical protein [Flavisolibacter sp.]